MQPPSFQSITKTPSQAKASFKNIVDSIMMEAAEKCEEIDVKCDEEYQILRRKEISENGVIIEKADKKRRAMVVRDDKVSYTKQVNGARLALLKAKNDIYNEILNDAKKRLAADRSSRREQLLQNSLCQAMYMLMEPEVHVTCRQSDRTSISDAFPSAARAYEARTRLKVTISFSKVTLPETSFPGSMLVSNKKETVSVNCSMDFRVDHVCHLAMPMIGDMLFMGLKTHNLPLPKAMIPLSFTASGHQKRPSSTSPEAAELLMERVGIGSSAINVLAPTETNQVSNNNKEDLSSSSTEVPIVSSKPRPSRMITSPPISTAEMILKMDNAPPDNPKLATGSTSKTETQSTTNSPPRTDPKRKTSKSPSKGKRGKK